jgi:beta-phosphoglucomutase-like phosphatase (HAD superfamily)
VKLLKHFHDLKATKHGSNFALMHHIVGDDPPVVHGKPLPDVFLIAAQCFQVSVVPATGVFGSEILLM